MLHRRRNSSSGLPMRWDQGYTLWSMERSLQQIIRHLESARWSLRELYSHEPQEVTPGPGYQDTENMTLSSDAYVQVALTPKPNQGLPVENMKSVLSTVGPQCHSTTSVKLTSELQFQGVKSEEELNLLPGQQDVKFSEFTSGPKLQGVKFGEQTPASMLHGVNSMEMTPTLGLQESEVSKVSLGLQGEKHVEITSRPRREVKYVKITPDSKPRAVKSVDLTLCSRTPELKTVELVPGTQQQEVKAGTLKLGPKRQESQQQGLKSLEFTPEQKLAKSKTCETIFSVFSASYKICGISTSALLQRGTSEELTPRTSSEHTDSSEIIQKPEHQSVEYEEMTPKPRHQVLNSVNLPSIPISQVTESLEIAQELAHQGTETVKKLEGLTSRPTGKAMES
ncbi:hypothetical protein MUG91_G9n46 [Manis pentadactyla]|nr:hypothetical protein MUG91_G9n46 [Manis pentadactyla]